MRWYKPLYLGEKAKEKRFSLLQGLRRGRPLPRVYVITLAAGGNNLLDIYPQPELLLPYYRKREFLILGVALGYFEALEVARQIVDDVYQATGTLDVKTYLEDRA